MFQDGALFASFRYHAKSFSTSGKTTWIEVRLLKVQILYNLLLLVQLALTILGLNLSLGQIKV